jgi:hypothetical protein
MKARKRIQHEIKDVKKNWNFSRLAESSQKSLNIFFITSCLSAPNCSTIAISNALENKANGL